MQLKKILIILLLSFCSNVNALTTFGLPNCGDWVKEKSITDKAWLLGYISAQSAYSVSYEFYDPYSDITANQIFLWMDNYCQKNPLNNINSGAIILSYELFEKKPKRPKK